MVALKSFTLTFLAILSLMAYETVSVRIIFNCLSINYPKKDIDLTFIFLGNNLAGRSSERHKNYFN